MAVYPKHITALARLEDNMENNEILPPLKAIRAHCIICCGDDHPKKCCIFRCPLYCYRLGHNPTLQNKVLSEKQIKNLFKKQ